jgi:hypothetical protein
MNSESPGTQLLEEILADGICIAQTVIASQTGDEQSMSIIPEPPYSPEPQTIILIRTTDPRLG